MTTNHTDASKPKVADRPHYVSIVLSVIALVISCLSWWEARYGRMINQSSNRAVAHVTGLRALEPITENTSNVHGALNVKNFGRSTARAISFSYITADLEKPPAANEYPNKIDSQLWDSLPPGLEKEIRIEFPYEYVKDLLSEDDTHVYGILQYVDEGSGEVFTQRWCFRLVWDNVSECSTP